MNGSRFDARHAEPGQLGNHKRWSYAMPANHQSAKSVFDRLRDNFDARDWNRGATYTGRSFRWVSTENDIYLARISGSSPLPYTVTLELSAVQDGVAEMDCTCPRFADAGICKHVAALVQAMEMAGYLDRYSAVGRIKMVEFDGPMDQIEREPDDWDDDKGFDEEGYEDEPDEPLPNLHIHAQKYLTKGNPSAISTTLGRKGWRDQIAHIDALRARTSGPSRSSPSKLRKLHFVLDVARSAQAGTPVVVFFHQEQLKNGDWSVLKRSNYQMGELATLFSRQECELLLQLLGGRLEGEYYSGGYTDYTRVTRCVLSPILAADQLAKLCAAGCCSIVENSDVHQPQLVAARVDEGPAWQFQLNWKRAEKPKSWTARGEFVRAGTDGAVEKLALDQTRLVFANGLMLHQDQIARVDQIGADHIAWLAALRRDGEIVVPEKEVPAFVERFYQSDPPAGIDVPEPLRWQRVRVVPKPEVQLKRERTGYRRELLMARARFDYDGTIADYRSTGVHIADATGQRLIERDLAEEAGRIGELRSLGFVSPDYSFRNEADLQLIERKLNGAVAGLTERGWKVEAEGRTIRRPGTFNISVTSGVDWFDLAVECDFDGVRAALPDLLKAIEKGENYVALGDGSRGMLPEEWLKKYAPIAALGQTEGDSLRFLPSQAMILDALLAAQPDAKVDRKFRQIREKLQSFDGVKPMQEPATFQGTLREYQREGLGWLDFLREFGFGGCLADDMGLGKTIQVLALLERIRASKAKKNTDVGPSLVVAPKSLVFNWIEEAKRFAPKLKVLNHTGIERRPITESAPEHDLVLTTYGTLRRDILELKKIPFLYAILDEAQAIKNGNSQSAKASRLLNATHRLVMTGTPVENQLGDLWSLFEFLNPGMLGASSELSLFAGKSRVSAESVELLAKALRPFLLRRTKGQVLKELPSKTEQTLYCELEPKQRKYYTELRDYYRALLAKKIETVGLAKSKIHVLEALLRLRQVACHPALVDKSKANLPSAKLDALLEQLSELIEEGHKVLVFSQFTSLLAIVRKEFEERGIVYEYLDGKTRDRQARVERFQTDEACKVFLISLKAGGSGLNLTAADYVFILDPWWNPAVEMQAVDRAHRIGQTKPVFAYRFIAQDTVEEKILELQSQKRALAEAVITADENLLRTLTAEDLQLLLS